MPKNRTKRPVIAYLAHTLIGAYHMQQWLALHEHAIACNGTLHLFSPFLFYSQKTDLEGYSQTFDLAIPEHVDGVIVSGASLNVFFKPEELVDLFERFKGIPLVTIAMEHPGVPSLLIDNYRGFYSLVDHMAGHHGYRKIAFIQGTPGNTDARERFEVFQTCLHDHGIPFSPDLALPGDFGMISGHRAIEELLDVRGIKPDAIICANDDMALGALEELTRRGIRVPQDIALAGFDDIETASNAATPLTTVSQGIAEQAEAALDLLLRMIEGKPAPARIEQQAALILRQSCGCTAPTTPTVALANREQFIQAKSHEIFNEKGYNLGQITSFSKNVQEALSLDVLREQLQTICAELHIPTLFIALYQGGAPLDRNQSGLPVEAEVFFSLVDGRVDLEPQRFPVRDLVTKGEAFLSPRRTAMISEFVFHGAKYGYCVAEQFMPDPVLFHMLNLQVSNGLGFIHMKAQMDAAYRKLEELDILKNEFISNITHDFRSPLTITLGTSEMGLLDAQPDSEDQQRYQVIFDASLKLKATIDRFLELSKMDNSGLKIKVAPVHLPEFIAGIVNFYRSAMVKSAIEVELDLPETGISDFYTDQEKLEEILHNLISNAVKFVDPQHGRITIAVIDGTDALDIRVIDNGLGIPPDQLEAVFERFTQLAPSRNQRARGTGIGLAFSRQLAAYLHGNLSANSDGPGTGAAFVLRLPKGSQHFSETELAAGIQPPRSPDSGRSEMRSLLQLQLKEQQVRETVVHLPSVALDDDFEVKQAIILIIEDSAAILELERSCLAASGYRNFILAPDGKRGVEAAYLHHPDIIVCDVNMPGLRGDELYAQLSQTPEFAKTPFIFVSAVAEREFIIDLRQRGVVAFLTKPIDATELILTVDLHVRAVLERKRLLKSSQIDELTGLHTRRSLVSQIMLQFSSRSYRDFSFIFLDVDHFKLVNDTWGHATGDLVLAAIGRCIQANLRPYDLSGRYGGEEFLLLLPDTNLADALKAAEKLRRLIAGLVVPAGERGVRVTASFGVSSLKDQASSLVVVTGAGQLNELFEPPAGGVIDWKLRDSDLRRLVGRLIELADQALYRAKNSGRNRVEYIQ